MDPLDPMHRVACPGCGRPMVRVVLHDVHHDCPSCHGRLLGLVPFQELVTSVAAGAVWRGAETGPVTGRCPFCDGALHAPDTVPAAGGLAVCRRCEQVWIPRTAEAWVEANAALVEGASPPEPTHPHDCSNCGAPFSPDDEGRCRYCRMQLLTPVPIVFPMHPVDEAAPSVGQVIGSLARILTD